MEQDQLAGPSPRVEVDGGDHATAGNGADGNAHAHAGRTIVVQKPAVSVGPATTSRDAVVRFRVSRLAPWSVFKHALIFSAGTLVVVMAGLLVLYYVLDSVGVLRNIQHLVNSAQIGHHFRFDAAWILTRLLWIGLFMVVVGSLVVTCLAVFYNAASEVVGGLDVSLEPADGAVEAKRQRSRARPWHPIGVGLVARRANDGNGKGRAETLRDAAGF